MAEKSRSAPESREAEPSELADIIRESWFGFGPRENPEALAALEELLAQHERALVAAEAALAAGDIAVLGWRLATEAGNRPTPE